jgi:hypothetical protein
MATQSFRYFEAYATPFWFRRHGELDRDAFSPRSRSFRRSDWFLKAAICGTMCNVASNRNDREEKTLRDCLETRSRDGL